MVVSSGADLLDAKYSVGRDIYDGYIIEDIYCEKGNEYISFTSKPDILKLGQAIGEVDPDEYKRLQIRKTIEEHMDKEMRLRLQGIKVLSLFFIDKVANYRWYDDDGNPQKGKFALMFEEEYARAIRKPKYNILFEGADLDVDFDVDVLASKCAEEIKANLQVGKARFIYRKAKAEIERGGVHAEQVQETASVYEARSFELPDLITYLQNETNLTRRTIVKIINDSGRLESFKNNPQKFIEQVSTIIQHQMRLFVVDGIKYHKIGDDHYYAQELFSDNELFGYLQKNMVESKKSVFDHVVYDSDIELEFATAFERSDDIKLYAKLPDWFKIDTPLGTYNPDWAVLIEVDGKEKLYFVVETKSTLFTDALRSTEKAKIACGKEHFKALGNEVEFAVTNAFEEFSGKYV